MAVYQKQAVWTLAATLGTQKEQARVYFVAHFGIIIQAKTLPCLVSPTWYTRCCNVSVGPRSRRHAVLQRLRASQALPDMQWNYNLVVSPTPPCKPRLAKSKCMRSRYAT